jgi:hypothetical protein
MSMRDEVARRIVGEAFAKHRIKVDVDDPILVFTTIVELTLAHLTGKLQLRVDESVAAFDAAAGKSLDALDGLAAERAKLRSQVTEDVRSVLKQFLGETTNALARVRYDDEKAAGYRIEEATKRALAVGGDPRWKHWLVGAVVGWSSAVVVYIVVNLAGRHW